MRKTDHKSKSGFTLLELLIVVAISMFLMISLGVGAFNLQSTMKLDNSLREIKSEVQSTQNLARNSFFSNSTNTGSLSGRRISVGWVFTLKNGVAPKSTSIVKRSIYILPAAGIQYDLSLLRADIIKLRQSLSGSQFYCDSTDDFLKSASNITVKFPTTPTTTDVKCSENTATSTASGEYIAIPDKSDITFTDTIPSGGISSCLDLSKQNGVNIFFTSGYGEPAISKSSDCEIRLQSSSSFLSNFRALRINVETGGAGTCGSYCQ